MEPAASTPSSLSTSRNERVDVDTRVSSARIFGDVDVDGSSSPGLSFNSGAEESHSVDNHPSSAAQSPVEGDQTAPSSLDSERQRRLAVVIASLRMYNPDFHLTPDVLAIMRAFFEDLGPDARGTVPLHALFDELERLDPRKELVAEETRTLMRRDIEERCAAHERIDFTAFCAWVMRWKEISPLSVQNVYTSWAKQLAMMDFGLNEGDGMLVVRSEELPDGDELRFHLSELLGHRRRHRHAAARNAAPASNAARPEIRRSGEHNEPEHDRLSTFEAATTDESTEQFAIFESPPLENPSDEDAEDGEATSTTAESTHTATTHTMTTTTSSQDSMMTVSKSFVAGGAAGIMAKSLLAPVDRVKILFQVNDKRTFSFRNAFRLARDIYVQDGFRALFRGNLLNILRVVPYAGVQHSSFDFFRRQFHAYNYKHIDPSHNQSGRDPNKLSNMQLVTAGSLAGGLSLTIAYPLDIVRARFMVQQGKHKYTSLYQAVLEMYRLEGARSFTRGLLPSLMGTLPYTGIGFTLNEHFKHWMLELQQRSVRDGEPVPTRLHPFAKFLCSYFAACIAQTATYPMDTIRRRIQTDGFVTGSGSVSRGGHGQRYTGVVTTAQIILRHEGWRGFFKGVSVNWMRSPLATGISLTSYDLFKEVLGVEKIG
ncbi:hypothetical protein PINS_up009902 [Pythium insidiosum]|nr:hypothetical protein PINS_up009902 [Pythium insidiosum]